MVTVVDQHGEREVLAEDLAELRAGAEADFRERTAALTWRPIAEYDNEAGKVVLLDDGADQWDLGYWGLPDETDANDPTAPVDRSPFWRHAQDHRQGLRLGFTPSRFAVADDDWTAALMED